MATSHGMSREGLLPAAIGVLGLWSGLFLARSFGLRYMEPGRGRLLLAGLACLVLAAVAVARLVRRADYPWLMLVAVAALPLFEPQNKPDTLLWRVFSGLYGLAIVSFAVWAFTRMVARTDELERRINHEALAFAFAASLVLVMAWSLLSDLLPPISGKWVATVMTAAWLVGWNAAVRRYR
jgi:hypothetical protein